MSEPYNHKAIEKKWQEYWKEHDIYKQIQICVYLFFQFTKGEAWLLALWKFVRRL